MSPHATQFLLYAPLCNKKKWRFHRDALIVLKEELTSCISGVNSGMLLMIYRCQRIGRALIMVGQGGVYLIKNSCYIIFFFYHQNLEVFAEQTVAKVVAIIINAARIGDVLIGKIGKIKSCFYHSFF